MTTKSTPKRVLFAHQSTIPHYRVPFYDALENQRSESWCFDVVFDLAELEKPQFFSEPLNVEAFSFPLLKVKTYSIQIRGKKVSYQTFWRQAAGYDLIIAENAVNNLAYPLCQLHQFFGTRYAYWGHGRDHGLDHKSGLKKHTEQLKMVLARRADGFFSYTPGVRDYLVQEGLSPQRVFTVNNTIDINEQRRLFEYWLPQRPLLRQQFNLQEKKALLFVGRFTENKRLDFLLEAFSILHEWDPAFHLLIVGSGAASSSLADSPHVTYLGTIVEPDQLAKVYVASDLFSFPGSVGLGPLQALCYNLPVITIDSNVQMPEIDYLNDKNSIVLDVLTNPEEYAKIIFDLFADQVKLRALKESIWPSIRHLTIEQMAQNFIQGINTILAA